MIPTRNWSLLACMAKKRKIRNAENVDKTRRKKCVENTDDAWKGQEKAVARGLSGRRTRGSGCGNDKGDVVSTLFRSECKTTIAASISVKAAWLSKIASEASGDRKAPMLVFGFDNGVPGTSQDWASVPMPVFVAMSNVVNEVLKGNLEEAEEWAQQVK